MKEKLRLNVIMLRIILKTSPFRTAMALFLAICSVGLNVLGTVVFLKYILDALVVKKDFQEVLLFILGVAFLFLLNSTFNSITMARLIPISNKNISKVVQEMIYRKMIKIDIECYDNPQFYNDYILALREIEYRAINTLTIFIGFIENVLTIVAMALFVISLDRLMIFFSVLPIVFSIMLAIWGNKVTFSYNTKMLPLDRTVDYVKRIFYLQQYAKELQATKIGDVILRKLHDALDGSKDIIRKFSKKQTFLLIAQNNIHNLFCYYAMQIYLSYRILVTGSLTVGSFVGLSNAVNSFISSLTSVFAVVAQIDENALYIKKVMDLLNRENNISDGRHPLPSMDGDFVLELKNVSFRYPQNENSILRNINLIIRKNEKIAIVGENGAGKTTLVKLIYRFYDPTEGEILLNGQDIRSFSVDEYRSLLNAVFQDFQVFAATIAENVTMRPYEVSQDNLIKDALEKSRLELGNIYQNLTREFDDNGIILSGGQTQKLALSRIFANPDRQLFILDEPSSALDPLSEYYIINKLNEYFKEKAIIYISHRLYTTKSADRIYLIQKGVVIESGTHENLMDAAGVYADMFEKQSEKFSK
jgi:ATP-binding cassette subfamily B protein